MKTELLHEYELEQGMEISSVLPIDQDNFLVLVYKNKGAKKEFYINIEGGNYRKIKVTPVQKRYDFNFFTSLFKYKNGFGLMEYTGRLSLWEELRGNGKQFVVRNPFPTENEFVKGFASSICHDGNDFVMGIEEPISYRFPSKYWVRLALKPKSFLGIQFLQNRPVMGEMYSLDLANYPKTQSHSVSDWLNILALVKKDDSIYLHTNGGAITRSKSGPDYEFSILSVLDKENNLIRNVNVEEGRGYFSTDKKYFILVPRKNKKKVLFYSLQNLEVAFEMPISDPEIKSKFISFDLFGDHLYAYGKDFLRIKKLIN